MFLNDRNFDVAETAQQVAAEVGATSAQVALAWLLSRPGIVIPIVGTRRESQIRDNLGALDIELSDDQLGRLDEVSKIDLGFPHEFIKSPGTRELAFGNSYSLLDDHRAERSGRPVGM
jgi:diketogulonate reductase-like aldo/keto reductase